MWLKKLLIDLVEEDEDFMTDPQPMVVVSELNDYNNKIVLAVWLRNERDHIIKRFQLRERMFEALKSAEVDMPLETLQLAPMDVQVNASAN